MERDNTEAGGVDIELADRVPVEPWFGYRREEATAHSRTGTAEDRAPVTVQTVPSGRWSQDHLDRLLLTAPTADRDTDGLVPVVAVTRNEPGEQVVVSLRTDAPRFQERLDFRTPPPWNEGAGVALAAALAVEKGHSLGLRHGALQPTDVVVAGSELAVAGMGLSLGGTPDPGIPMAPEVARSGVPTVTGDVYSLGRLLDAGTAGDPNTPPEIAAIIVDATTEEIGKRIPSALTFAERLEEAGGGVMRSYSPMTFSDSPLFSSASADADLTPGAAPAIKTSAATPFVAEKSRSVVGKALPWLVGAGLVGVIGFGLWAAATSGDGEAVATSTTLTSVVSTSPTTAATTSTAAPSTTSPTTAPQTTPSTSSTASTASTASTTTSTSSTSTTVPSTSTTAPPTSTTTLPPPPDVPAVPASDAGLEVVHGLSQPVVDAYLDGELLVAGFAPGEIAGPLYLPEGDYDLQLFSAVDNPAVSTETRTDTPLVSEAVPISGRPQAVIVASDGEGDEVVVRTFVDDLTPIEPGQGRLAIRNPSSSTILVTLDPVTDGLALERQAVSPGAVLSTDLPTGDYRLFVTEEDRSPLLATVASNPEGELTSATFLRDGTPRLVFQRIGGLGSPPDGIPTGTGGLLPGSEDPTVWLLIAALGGLGLFVLVGRERLAASGRR